MILSLSDRYEISTLTDFGLTFLKFFNFFFNKIDITMTIAKKKLEIFVRYWPATENPTSGTSRVLFSKITRPWEVQKDVYVWTVFKPYIFNSRYKLILSSIRMLLNIIFRCKEILVYFLSCDLENYTFCHPTRLSATLY